MPPRSGGGPAPNGWLAAQLLGEILDLFLHPDLRLGAQKFSSGRRPPSSHTGTGSPCHSPACRMSPTASRTRAWKPTGTADIGFAGDVDRVMMRSTVHHQEPVSVSPTASLSTVLFTDIVGSTEARNGFGDQAWATLDAHDRIVERHVASARGSVTVKFTGDGALATFDRPARASNTHAHSRRGPETSA